MNIGIFTDCYLPTKNGVTTSIVYLKEGLEQRGHKIVVLTVQTPEHFSTEPGVYRVPSLPFNSAVELRFGLVNQPTVERIVRREQLDLLHTHTEFSLGLAGKRAARILKLPLIHTCHTMYQEYRHYLALGRLLPPMIIRRWLTWFLQQYHTIICPSLKMQQFMASCSPSLKTVVIGNGVSRRRFHARLLTPQKRDVMRSALGLCATDKVVLYVGRIAREKRVVELLNALTPMLRRRPNYKVVFIGNGACFKQMQAIAHDARIASQVILTGYIACEEMPRYYAMADLFATASLSEVHPMTLIEAALCGLPIVARDDASFVDIVSHGVNGYLVETDRQITARICRLFEDGTIHSMFSQQALRLSEQFSAARHVAQCEALYQRVCKAHLQRLPPARV